MGHPVIHAEIRSADSDATRAFFSELFGWTYSDGAFPGYTFVDTGVGGALPTAIGPLQGERLWHHLADDDMDVGEECQRHDAVGEQVERRGAHFEQLAVAVRIEDARPHHQVEDAFVGLGIAHIAQQHFAHQLQLAELQFGQRQPLRGKLAKAVGGDAGEQVLLAFEVPRRRSLRDADAPGQFAQAEFGLLCPVNLTDSSSELVRRFGSDEIKAKYLEAMWSQNLDSLLKQGSTMAGSYATAREKGLLRLEGKDYIMQEGDVVHFRFNV